MMFLSLSEPAPVNYYEQLWQDQAASCFWTSPEQHFSRGEIYLKGNEKEEKVKNKSYRKA